MNHVSSKNVLTLGVVSAIAIAVAVAINASHRPASEGAQVAQPLLPELREHLNEVSAISLTGAGDKPIATLEKGANGWTLKEKGYAADGAKLREFLLKLGDATLLEAKTSSDKRYAELGVEDVKAADAKGVLVALSGLPKPAQFIVGNYNAKGAGTFVRRAGEAQSWLAKGNLNVDKTASNWLDKALADIPAARIREVVLTSSAGKTLRAYKEQSTDANFKVADVPRGRELSSEFAANGLGTALAGLRFDDVLAAKDAAPPADGKPSKARIATFDGLVVDVTAWKKDDKVQAQFAAGLDAAQAEATIAADQAKTKADFEAQQAEAAKAGESGKAASGDGKTDDAKSADAAKPEARPKAQAPIAVSDPAKDKQQRLDALNKEVAELKQRFDGWTYVLPNYRFDNFAKDMDALLKPLESKKDAKAVPAPTPKSLSEALKH